MASWCWRKMLQLHQTDAEADQLHQTDAEADQLHQTDAEAENSQIGTKKLARSTPKKLTESMTANPAETAANIAAKPTRSKRNPARHVFDAMAVSNSPILGMDRTDLTARSIPRGVCDVAGDEMGDDRTVVDKEDGGSDPVSDEDGTDSVFSEETCEKEDEVCTEEEEKGISDAALHDQPEQVGSVATEGLCDPQPGVGGLPMILKDSAEV
ncbi:hypothetical protein U1Q18_025671 [Sarracenia purpurea var. burkii]